MRCVRLVSVLPLVFLDQLNHLKLQLFGMRSSQPKRCEVVHQGWSIRLQELLNIKSRTGRRQVHFGAIVINVKAHPSLIDVFDHTRACGGHEVNECHERRSDLLANEFSDADARGFNERHKKTACRGSVMLGWSSSAGLEFTNLQYIRSLEQLDFVMHRVEWQLELLGNPFDGVAGKHEWGQDFSDIGVQHQTNRLGIGDGLPFREIFEHVSILFSTRRNHYQL